MTGVIYELGTGTFGWNRFERQSDRYGTVGLWDEDDTHVPSFAEAVRKVPPGTRGALRAEVVEARASGHIGDLFRGISSQERVAGVVTLGEGTFICEWVGEGGPYAGVQPYEPRDTDWLDPKLLYQLHDSVVRLFFETEAR